MVSHPAPRRKDHLTFCLTERWTEVRNAVGGTVRHHQTFELALSDGRILRTHISRPANSKETYGAGLWTRILRDQLRVTADVFWACVKNGTVPDRGVVTAPTDTIPADVLTVLMHRGISEQAVLSMGREAAMALLVKLLSEPRP